MTRFAVTVAFTLVVGGAASALRAAEPPVNLTEKVATDVRTKSSVELGLKGELYFAVEGKKEAVRLEAKARHAFAERILVHETASRRAGDVILERSLGLHPVRELLQRVP